MIASPAEKKCSKCRKIYLATAENFHKCRGAKDGLNSWCKPCNLEACRQYRSSERGQVASKSYQRSGKGKQAQKRYADTANGKRKRRNNGYKSKYNFTLKQYEQLLHQQHGVCAICGKPETANNKYGTRFLAVDHDHATGKVRALLCDRCNRMIGFAKESKRILHKAIEYLANFE